MASQALTCGRPAIYSDELADRVCERIRNGEALYKICLEDGMPSQDTVERWLHADLAGFAVKYARARESQADYMDARILEVANGTLDGSYDPLAARVAIAAYQWRAERLKPKVYGNASMLKLADADGNNLVFRVEDARKALPPATIERVD